MVPSGKCRSLSTRKGAGLPSRSVAAWRGFSAVSAVGVVVVGLGRLVGLLFFARCGGAHSIAFRVFGYSFVSWCGFPVSPVMIARPGISGRSVRAVAFCGRPSRRSVLLGVSPSRSVHGLLGAGGGRLRPACRSWPRRSCRCRSATLSARLRSAARAALCCRCVSSRSVHGLLGAGGGRLRPACRSWPRRSCRCRSAQAVGPASICGPCGLVLPVRL